MLEVPPRLELPINCRPHWLGIASLVRLLDPPDDFDFFARPGLARECEDSQETWDDVLDGITQCVHLLKQRHKKEKLFIRSQLDELVGALAARTLTPPTMDTTVNLADIPAGSKNAPGSRQSKRSAKAQPQDDDADSNCSDGSAQARPSAMPVAAAVVATPHDLERRRRKERKEDFADLQNRLKTFKQGWNFEAWMASNLATLTDFVHLPESLRITAVEQKLDAKVTKLMEPLMKDITTLDQFLNALLASFGPDLLNLNRRLGQAKQLPGMSASQFVTHLSGIYDSCNCTLPSTAEEIMTLVPKFLPATYDKLEAALQMHSVKHNVLAFADLQRFAKHHDERIVAERSVSSETAEPAASKASPKPVAVKTAAARASEKASAPQTTLPNGSKFCPVLEWDDDADSGPSEVAFNTRSHTSRGRGKKASAGRVKIGMVRAGASSSSAPQDLSDLKVGSSEAYDMYPPVQPEEVHAEDRSEWESHSSLILPDVQQLLDDEAPLSMRVALNKAVGRPRKAEQLVLTPDDAPEPVNPATPLTDVQITEGNMRDRSWRPIMNNSPGSKVANAQIPSMSLELMAELSTDPVWIDLVPRFNRLFDKYKRHPSVTDKPQAILAAVQAAVFPSSEFSLGGVDEIPASVPYTAATPAAAPSAASPSASAAPSAPATSSPPSLPAPASAHVKMVSVQATSRTSARTYAVATTDDERIYKKNTVGMTNVPAWLNADEGSRRVFHIDDGCNLSCMSEQQFEKDRGVLLRSGTVHELQPVPVSMIDGQATQATKIVKDVVFSIGVAKYTCDFLVIPMPDLGYVLGADFLAYYDVSKQWRNGLLRLGVIPDSVLPIVKQKYKPYQTVPMRRPRGTLPLHLK